MIMRWIVLFLFATFSNTHIHAQDTTALPDSLTLEKAIATALQFKYDIELSRNDSAIARNYYSNVRAVLQLRVIDEQIVLNEDRYRLAKYRFEIGVGVKPDMLQAQIDLNAQKGARLAQLALIEQSKQNLNRLMNVTPDVRYKVSDTIVVQMNLTLKNMQSGIEETNPQLRLARKNIDIAGLSLREQRAERWPTISFNSAYNF